MNAVRLRRMLDLAGFALLAAGVGILGDAAGEPGSAQNTLQWVSGFSVIATAVACWVVDR